MASAAPSPTFLMPASPNRMPSPSGVKRAELRLTSGRSMGRPMSVVSVMKPGSLSKLPISEVIWAAMNSAGKLAFM